jgi:hypothetical protein
VGQRRKTGRRGVGLRLEKKEGRERREGGVWEGVFFFLFFFKLLSQTFKSFKLFQNFSSFKLFSKNFKSV